MFLIFSVRRFAGITKIVVLLLLRCIVPGSRQIVFIQGEGSMLIVIISKKHFKEVTHEKDIQCNPV